jgi:hypothetical protein
MLLDLIARLTLVLLHHALDVNCGRIGHVFAVLCLRVSRDKNFVLDMKMLGLGLKISPCSVK